MGDQNTGQILPAQLAGYWWHHAMCKIDYLGTGLCASGVSYHFLSYYPQGRMDLYAALQGGTIPLTPEAANIADTCSLCGRCDYQCHFKTGMRPMEVMKALKRYVETHRHLIEVRDREDPVYDRLAGIVGYNWCSSDPAVTIAYASDPGTATPPTPLSYVVLPASTGEVSAIMDFCQALRLDFAVRGNGSGAMGFVMGKDLVIDMSRINHVEIVKESGLVRAGAGVPALQLQQQVYKKGYRVQVGEPPAPNLFAYAHKNVDIPGICTEVSMKLYPRLEDERGFLVPFRDFEQALAFTREMGQQRIGLAAGLLGGECLAAFLSPSSALAHEVKHVLHEELGIAYVVQMIGDQYHEDAVRKMDYPVISQRLFRTLVLSLPSLIDNEVLIHFNEMMPGDSVYDLLSDRNMEPLLEALLQPDAAKLAQTVPSGMKDFYGRLCQDPRLTDLVWLNDFRITMP